MTTFDEREKAFERKFAHDQDLRFRATARRNKLFGLWAAEKLGLSDAEAGEYAKSVIRADFQEPGDDDVLRKVKGDFDAKGVDQSYDQLLSTLTDMMAEALRQIESEGGKIS
jgi:hypothetical protein